MVKPLANFSSQQLSSCERSAHSEDAQGKSSNTGKSEQLPGCKCVFKQDSHKALGMTGKYGHELFEIKLVKQLTMVPTMGKALCWTTDCRKETN